MGVVVPDHQAQVLLHEPAGRLERMDARRILGQHEIGPVLGEPGPDQPHDFVAGRLRSRQGGEHLVVAFGQESVPSRQLVVAPMLVGQQPVRRLRAGTAPSPATAARRLEAQLVDPCRQRRCSRARTHRAASSAHPDSWAAAASAGPSRRHRSVGQRPDLGRQPEGAPRRRRWRRSTARCAPLTEPADRRRPTGSPRRRRQRRCGTVSSRGRTGSRSKPAASRPIDPQHGIEQRLATFRLSRPIPEAEQGGNVSVSTGSARTTLTTTLPTNRTGAAAGGGVARSIQPCAVPDCPPEPVHHRVAPGGQQRQNDQHEHEDGAHRRRRADGQRGRS